MGVLHELHMGHTSYGSHHFTHFMWVTYLCISQTSYGSHFIWVISFHSFHMGHISMYFTHFIWFTLHMGHIISLISYGSHIYVLHELHMGHTSYGSHHFTHFIWVTYLCISLSSNGSHDQFYMGGVTHVKNDVTHMKCDPYEGGFIRGLHMGHTSYGSHHCPFYMGDVTHVMFLSLVFFWWFYLFHMGLIWFLSLISHDSFHMGDVTHVTCAMTHFVCATHLRDATPLQYALSFVLSFKVLLILYGSDAIFFTYFIWVT